MVYQFVLALTFASASADSSVSDSLSSIASVLPMVIISLEDESRSAYPELNSGPLELDVAKISRLLKQVRGVGIDSASLGWLLGKDFVSVDPTKFPVQEKVLSQPPQDRGVFISMDTLRLTPKGLHIVAWSSMLVPGLSDKEYVGSGREWIFEFVYRRKRWMLKSKYVRAFIG